MYFLSVVRSEPHFTLEIDTDKTLLAPGMASVIFVRAERKNGNDTSDGTEGLPEDV